MRQMLPLLLLLLLSCPIRAQEGNETFSDKRINFGIKGGFNSSIYFIDHFQIGDMPARSMQNNYKVGYVASAFMRVNFKRHFLQPELSYSVSKSEITFDRNTSGSADAEPIYAGIDATIRTIDLPVAYGYNFIQSPPYEMYFFAGPRFKYVWKQKSRMRFFNFGEGEVTERLHPFNVSAVFGIGVRISRILFDFQYDIGIFNISKNATYRAIDDAGNAETVPMAFRRRNSLLSFSLGAIF